MVLGADMGRLGLMVLGLALLAGCGTPQERCIASATRDARILDRLITETQGNIDRGFAYVEVQRSRTVWVVCVPAQAATATSPAQSAQMCMDDQDYTETRPQAINLADERVKLAEMRKKRAELERAAVRDVASCKAQHPK
jgi:hypothetical protein